MEQFSINDIKKLIAKIEDKPTIYMNSKTHEAVLQLLDFQPTNIETNNYIPDNQAVVITKEQMDKMREGFFQYWEK